jgi:elongation factor P hydroxylase
MKNVLKALTKTVIVPLALLSMSNIPASASAIKVERFMITTLVETLGQDPTDETFRNAARALKICGLETFMTVKGKDRPYLKQARKRLKAARAFIVGGYFNPTADDIQEWVAHKATRQARVLVAALGLKSQELTLNATNYLLQLPLDHPTKDQVSAVTAFMSSGYNSPNLNQIGTWINAKEQNRPAILRLIQLGLQTTPEYIEATTAFMAHRRIAQTSLLPTAAYLNKWITDTEHRADIVKAVANFILAEIYDAAPQEIDEWIAANDFDRPFVCEDARIPRNMD